MFAFVRIQFLSGVICSICSIAALLSASGPALAQEPAVVFVNLGHLPTYLYRAEYSRGSSSTQVGDYSLPAETPASWKISLAGIVRAGTSLRVSPGSYFVRSNEAWTWNNLATNSFCAPKFNAAFTEYLDGNDPARSVNQLVNSNRAIRADFQTFPAGQYNIVNEGRPFHRITSLDQAFDFRSRNEMVIDRSYPFPNEIVDFRVTGESVGESGMRWTVEPSRMRIRGKLLEGRQTFPAGGRQQSYYTGKVTAWFVQYGVNKCFHQDAQTGSRFMFREWGITVEGGKVILQIIQDERLVHDGELLEVRNLQGQSYNRYRITNTADSASWSARNATRNGQYEAWVPSSGIGIVKFSDDGGKNFLPEERVPAAGWVGQPVSN